MARPREFCEQEALQSAMEVFWSKGYEGTSLCDLTEAMGISKSSFYETFGSKHDLYLETLRHYDETVVKRGASELTGGGSGKEAIRTILYTMIGNCSEESGRKGCFIGNSAVEMSAHDPEARQRVAATLRHMEDAFHAAVVRGQEQGDIAKDKDARLLARSLLVTGNGLQVAGRAEEDCCRLQEVADLVVDSLG